MKSIKDLINVINRDKRKEEAKQLVLVATLGASIGALIVLIMMPKSNSANKTLNKLKGKICDSVKRAK